MIVFSEPEVLASTSAPLLAISQYQHLKKGFWSAISFCLLFQLASFRDAGAGQPTETPEQLIARVLASRLVGFRGHARLVQINPQTEQQESKRIVIKARQEGKSFKMLYQAVWPSSVAGQAVLIEMTPGQPVKGFLMESPDKVLPLTPRLLDQPLFGSDFRIEDLTEDFWHWPMQEFIGTEIIMGCPCKIIESRPGSATQSGYSVIRSWVCPRLALPLRVERITRDGLPARRLSVEKIAKAGRGWAARSLLMTPTDGKSRTLFEGTSMEADVVVPAAEFSIEAIRSDFRRLKKIPGSSVRAGPFLADPENPNGIGHGNY
jgi:hypothetical protein